MARSCWLTVHEAGEEQLIVSCGPARIFHELVLLTCVSESCLAGSTCIELVLNCCLYGRLCLSCHAWELRAIAQSSRRHVDSGPLRGGVQGEPMLPAGFRFAGVWSKLVTFGACIASVSRQPLPR